MKKVLTILLLLTVSECKQRNMAEKENFVLPIVNYYRLQTKDIKSVDEVSIDSIVPVTERKHLEDGIIENEKRYIFFVEAKDDEYADSTALEIERMKQRLQTAGNSDVLYYKVYHTVKYTGNDLVRRKRESYLDITFDHKILPNAVTKGDSLSGIKGRELYKSFSY